MPSGDNARVWFPEMLSEMEQLWKANLDWTEAKNICTKMEEMLRNIRQGKGYGGTSKKCDCGGKMVLSTKISMRSLLYSLKNLGLITDDELNSMDKDWKKYQRKNTLDGYGEVKKPRIRYFDLEKGFPNIPFEMYDPNELFEDRKLHTECGIAQFRIEYVDLRDHLEQHPKIIDPIKIIDMTNENIISEYFDNLELSYQISSELMFINMSLVAQCGSKLFQKLFEAYSQNEIPYFN